MFGKALLISLGAFICSFAYKGKDKEMTPSMVALVAVIGIIFLIYVISIFL